MDAPAPRTFLYTIGHSTRPIEETVAILQNYVIAVLIDVRKIPRSARNPQYHRQMLEASLRAAGIAYSHWPELGGLRRPAADSPNHGWKNKGFRGYADYMLTEDFEAAIERLVRQARSQTTVILCAEAYFRKCHRMLISDALTVRGVDVIHLVDINRVELHKLTPFARVSGHRIVYGAPLQPGLFD